MSSALVLQTQDNCPPGVFGAWAESRAVELDIIRVDRWDPLPSPSSYTFAVVLGSDASVLGPRSEWVDHLLGWLAGADSAGLPVLGICFGAQALAAALGGGARRLEHPEQQWIELLVDSNLPMPRGPWLALHEDAVVLPERARLLAHNAFGPQMFGIGRHLGVQFHPEVTSRIVRRWATDKGDLLDPGLLVDVAGRCHQSATNALALFDLFVKQSTPTITAGVS